MITHEQPDTQYDVAQVNWALLKRLGDIWHKKASVRKGELEYRLEDSADRPDFPRRLVPFHDHPRFLALPAEAQSRILSWGWIAYNERTITAEEKIANPAFQLILNNEVPGVNHGEIKRAVGQAMVDEQYHTLMHMNANLLTKEARGLGDARLPYSITYRTYLKCISEAASEWERNVITLLFATVSEISINALLSLLSTDQEIQPLHRLITYHHDRDEVGHMLMLEEIAKNIFLKMSRSERAVFIRWLPDALSSFVATDYSSWQTILRINGFSVSDAEEVIRESSQLPSRGTLVRDYQGLERLVKDLGIGSALGFDFSSARGGRTTDIIPPQMEIEA